MKDILSTKNSKDYELNIKTLLRSEHCSRSLRVKFIMYCLADLKNYYDVDKYSEVYKIQAEFYRLLEDYRLNPSFKKKKSLFKIESDLIVFPDLRPSVKNSVLATIRSCMLGVAMSDSSASELHGYLAAHNLSVVASDKYSLNIISRDCKIKELYELLFDWIIADYDPKTLKVLYGSSDAE